MSRRANAQPMMTRKLKPFAWTRFGLKTFLVSISIACVLLGWKANQVRVQRHAINQIEAASGRVVLSSHSDADGFPTAARPPRWNPLRGRLDDLWFDSVFSVWTPHLTEDYRRTGKKYLPNTIYAQALGLPNVRYLRLSYSDISNEDVSALERMHELRILNLSCTKVREGPLNGLNGLPIRSLFISRTRLDDEGVKSLRGMASLRHLDLTRTKVTDECLRHLETLNGLRNLVLRRTLVTRDGVEEFKQKMPKCKVSWTPLVRGS